MRKVLIALAVVALLAMPATADTVVSKVISINFHSGSDALAASDEAGVVAIDNWNNFSSSNQSSLALVDDTGTTATATLSINNGYGPQACNASTGGSAANQALMNSGLAGISGAIHSGYKYTQVLLEDLDVDFPDGYDVYLYFGDISWGWASSSTSSADESFTVSDYVQDGPTSLPTPDDDETFTAGTNGTVYSGTFTAGANYVKFAGLTAADVVYSVDPYSIHSGGFSMCILTGIQIVYEEEVEVPIAEPAGLGLVGVALLGLRRRRRALALLVAVVAVGLFAGSANANVISINFHDGSNALAASDVAGLSAANNWNNFSTEQASGALIDNAGAATSVTLSTDGFAHQTCNASTGGSAANQTMMNSGLLSLQPINYSTGYEYAQALLQGLDTEFPDGYSVYLYFGDLSWGWAGSATSYVRESNTAGDFNSGNQNPSSFPTAGEVASATFTAGTNGTVYSGAFSSGANYVKWTGRTAGTAVYSIDPVGSPPTGGGFSTAILTGIQIVSEGVPIPEPAGLGLIGVALLGLRRRRS